MLNAESTAQLWRLPSLVDDDLPRIKVWVETMTGLGVDDKGNINALETEVWQERGERLRQLGGPPKTDSGWLFDSILYGPDPTARARAWMERKCWDEAEAAFSDVIRARPLRASAWTERGRFYIERSETEKAAADFVQALALGDLDSKLQADIVASDTAFDRVLALLPAIATKRSVRLWFDRGEHLSRLGQWARATSCLPRRLSARYRRLSESLSPDPDSAGCWRSG